MELKIRLLLDNFDPRMVHLRERLEQLQIERIDPLEERALKSRVSGTLADQLRIDISGKIQLTISRCTGLRRSNAAQSPAHRWLQIPERSFLSKHVPSSHHPTMAHSFAVATLIVMLSGCAATETRESVGEYAGDSVVTGKVKTALTLEDVSSLLSVEVETYRGVVQLSGFVNDEVEKRRAGDAAASVKGVSRVENSLLIKPGS